MAGLVRRPYVPAVLLVLLLLLAVAGMGLTAQLDRWFVFFPAAGIERTPASAGLPFEDIYFVAEDGVTLNGWYVPARAGAAAGPGRDSWTFLWFHGNAGNLSHRVADLATLHRRLGVNLFIFDYRGYGNSGGRPSEAGLYRDARAAWNYLASRPGAAPERVVFFGRSLGTSVAVELAAGLPPAGQPGGIILFSPFTSLGDMARRLYPYLPLHRLAGDRFNTQARIGSVHRPLLVIHGEQDEIVPVAQGRRLFRAANPPKDLLLLPHAGHNDNLERGDAELWAGLEGFLDSLRQ